MVKKSATRNGDAATASTSTHAQPVAGQDTEALFDPLFTLCALFPLLCIFFLKLTTRRNRQIQGGLYRHLQHRLRKARLPALGRRGEEPARSRGRRGWTSRAQLLQVQNQGRERQAHQNWRLSLRDEGHPRLRQARPSCGTTMAVRRGNLCASIVPQAAVAHLLTPHE